MRGTCRMFSLISPRPERRECRGGTRGSSHFLPSRNDKCLARRRRANPAGPQSRAIVSAASLIFLLFPFPRRVEPLAAPGTGGDRVTRNFLVSGARTWTRPDDSLGGATRLTARIQRDVSACWLLRFWLARATRARPRSSLSLSLSLGQKAIAAYTGKPDTRPILARYSPDTPFSSRGLSRSN